MWHSVLSVKKPYYLTTTVLRKSTYFPYSIFLVGRGSQNVYGLYTHENVDIYGRPLRHFMIWQAWLLDIVQRAKRVASWLVQTPCILVRDSSTVCNLPKPSHNRDIVSVHFNHFYWTEICDKLRRDLTMLIYIYFDVDECWLISSMP